jgi:glycogen operon protein
MTPADWEDAALRYVCVELRTASGTPSYADTGYALFLVFNSGDDLEVTLTPAPDGKIWSRRINSFAPDAPNERIAFGKLSVPGHSVSALVLEDA